MKRKTKHKIKVKYDKEIFQAILPNTLRTGSLSLSNYLIINFPIILSSYYLSLKVSGQFGFINQIVTLLLCFLTLITIHTYQNLTILE